MTANEYLDQIVRDLETDIGILKRACDDLELLMGVGAGTAFSSGGEADLNRKGIRDAYNLLYDLLQAKKARRQQIGD